MGETNSHEPDSEDRITEGTAWIHRTTVDESMEQLRTSLRDDGIASIGADINLCQAAHIACMRGATRKAAPLIFRLLERRKKAGKPVWSLDRETAALIGITMVRLFAAYAEDPAVPISRARAMAELFIESIRPFETLNSIHEVIRMILAVRVELGQQGVKRSRRNLPVRKEIEESGLCRSAHRQWRVEYLFACGEEELALELVKRGRKEKGCGINCAFSPHFMLAWSLEPLHQRGLHEEAHDCDGRLASLLQPRLQYLDAAGCRILHLAQTERFEEAGNLLAACLPLSQDAEGSPWKRVKFLNACKRAIDAAEDQGRLKSLMGPLKDGASAKGEILSALRIQNEEFERRG